MPTKPPRTKRKKGGGRRELAQKKSGRNRQTRATPLPKEGEGKGERTAPGKKNKGLTSSRRSPKKSAPIDRKEDQPSKPGEDELAFLQSPETSVTPGRGGGRGTISTSRVKQPSTSGCREGDWPISAKQKKTKKETRGNGKSEEVGSLEGRGLLRRGGKGEGTLYYRGGKMPVDRGRKKGWKKKFSSMGG